MSVAFFEGDLLNSFITDVIPGKADVKQPRSSQ